MWCAQGTVKCKLAFYLLSLCLLYLSAWHSFVWILHPLMTPFVFLSLLFLSGIRLSIYCFYRTPVRSLAMLVSDSLTHWLLFSKLDWCNPGLWRCQLKTCWCCVTVADEDCVGNNLLQIGKLRFGQKAKLLLDFEHKVWSRYWSWSSGKICSWSFLLLMFCRGYEVESWSRFWG